MPFLGQRFESRLPTALFHSNACSPGYFEMDDTAPQPAKVRRSLRSYLGLAIVGLALVGLFQLIFGLPFVRYSGEQEAAKRIEQLGGFVQFDDPPFGIPKSVYDRLPVRRRIRLVGFSEAMLETLPAEMMSLAGLEELHIESPAFTDEGMKQLTGLTTLKRLYLSRTSITDDGLKYLEGLTDLRIVDLQATKVGNSGLQSLSKLQQLRIVDLNETTIGDSGIETLSKLKELRWISLRGTQVTDEGLAHLKDLPFLRRLDLRHTKITDKGLDHLTEIKTLEILNIDSIQMTDNGMTRFKTQLPRCDISQSR